MTSENNIKAAFKNAVDYFNNNNLNESIEQLDEILKVFPSDVKSLSLLADIYVKKNDSHKALNFINQALSWSTSKQILLEKKYKILKFIGDEINSFSILEELHEKYPSINTAREISNIHLSKGNVDEADNVIQTFFETNANYSELYKGIRHAKAGRLKLAEDVYKKILKDDKNNIDALRLLGLIAFRAKNYDLAEKLFTRAISINPYFSLAWDNLGKVFRVQNKLSKSKIAFKNLLKIDPNNYEALVSLGTLYVKLAEYEKGIDCYKDSLKINPSNARVFLSMGHALKTLGKRKECESSYHNAIKFYPNSGEAYWSLANLKTYKFSDEEIESMETSLTNEIHPDEKIQMHFGLGKAYEANKNFKKSFFHYKEGNWLKRKSIEYNSEDNKNNTDLLINFFSEHAASIDLKSGFQSNDPIFILGLPRAGSTLLEQILASHSQIEGTQELPNIMGIGRQIKQINDSENYLNNLFKLSNDDIYKYGKMFIDDTRWARTNKRFFIDKMPNNFAHIGLIKMILPNAKIIDARRKPMDACLSCFKQYFAKGQLFTYDLDDIARYYKDYKKLMDYWNKLFPNSIHTVMYEDVILDSTNEIKKIFNFLELEFEDECMNFYKSSRPVKTASSEQVRQPIYKNALDYWKNFDDDLSDLKRHFNNDN